MFEVAIAIVAVGVIAAFIYFHRTALETKAIAVEATVRHELSVIVLEIVAKGIADAKVAGADIKEVFEKVNTDIRRVL